MLDRLAAARAFVAVAQTLNFTRAADSLGISVGQLSRLIAGFEKKTGRRLLHRSTRQVSLTTEGQSMLVRIQDFLDEADAIFSNESEAAGELRIAASVPFYDLGITTIVSEYLKTHPDLRIHYEVIAEPLDLVKKAVDVGFQEGSVPPDGYIAKSLGRIESWLCASPEYITRFGEPKTLADLTHHRLLSLTSCQKVWRFLPIEHTGKPIEISVSPVFTANYSGELLSLCLDNNGIAFQPIGATIKHVKAGRLKVVLPQQRGVPHIMQALVADRLNLSPLVRSFLDFVAHRLSEQNQPSCGKTVFLPVQ